MTSNDENNHHCLSSKSNRIALLVKVKFHLRNIALPSWKKSTLGSMRFGQAPFRSFIHFGRHFKSQFYDDIGPGLSHIERFRRRNNEMQPAEASMSLRQQGSLGHIVGAHVVSWSEDLGFDQLLGFRYLFIHLRPNAAQPFNLF